MVFGFAKESIRCIDPYNQHDNSGSHICKVSLRFFKKNLSVGCRWRVNNIGKVQEIKKRLKMINIYLQLFLENWKSSWKIFYKYNRYWDQRSSFKEIRIDNLKERRLVQECQIKVFSISNLFACLHTHNSLFIYQKKITQKISLSVHLLLS